MARDQKFLVQVPVAAREAFLGYTLDEAAADRRRQLLEDLGGADSVGVVKQSEAKDFVALDMLIEGILCDMNAGKAVDAGALCQLISVKLGLARVLGLDRRPKRVRGLHEHMAAAGDRNAQGAAA